MNKQIEALIAPPKDGEPMDVDGMLRMIGYDTQIQWLSKMREMDTGGPEQFKTPLYLARTVAIIGGVGLMAAIRAFRVAAPDQAAQFVREYWEMCESGDSFGEALWEFIEAAGIDPALVELPPSADAVDPHLQSEGTPPTREKGSSDV